MAERRIPDLLREQVALGEASARTREEVDRVLGKEGSDRSTESIRASDGEILARYPVEAMAARIRERAAATAPVPGPRLVTARPARRRRLSVPVALAAATLLAVTLVPRLVDLVSRPENLGIKGRASLLIYREDGEDAVLLPNGARAAQGDHIQIKYMSGGRAYGSIVSIDGRGSVTLHYPASAGDSTVLVPSGAALDYAYVLDDAPEFERFFLITSQSEFAAGLAIGAAEKLARRNAKAGTLDLPTGFDQTSIVLTKVPRGE